MIVWPKTQSRVHVAVALFMGVVFGAVVEANGTLPLGILTGAATAAGYYYASMHRYFTRLKLARQPFPESWRSVLGHCVPFYRALDPAGRARFETDVRLFLAEQNIYGLRGSEVAEDVRLLIAASAAMIGHGIPEWEWPGVRDILVYPTAFDEEYETADENPVSGIVHQQGPVIFSERDLRRAFCGGAGDQGNVGLHEMAHVMDMVDGDADGVPPGMSASIAGPWIRIMAERIRQIRDPRSRTLLRAYAGENEAEFFAVAVEAFFGRPREMKRRDPELYAMLAHYLNLDTASIMARLRTNPTTPLRHIPGEPQHD